MGYFTKSRFKLALECPTKLYYGANKAEYANQKVDDAFLMALAEGGYQVGELAKYLFCEDPIAENITVDTLDYQESIDLTAEKRAKGGRVVVAEAAFKYDNFFIRTDIVVEEGNIIKIYEVKAKSWDDSTEFLKTRKKGPNKGENYLDNDWTAYLYDIAFQKWVVAKANPGKEVRAHLVLVDKTKDVTIEGLNQIFKIKRNGQRIAIDVDKKVTQSVLGYIPLKILNVEDACEWIYSNPVNIHLDQIWGFEDLLHFLADNYIKNDRIWASRLGKKCKECEFVNIEYPIGLDSGFHECWKHLAKFTDEHFKEALILELWGGKAGAKSLISNAIDQDIYFLKHANEMLYASKTWTESPGTTLDATKRRNIQILKSKTNDYTPYLDIEGLREVFDRLPAPYHFIDFETTMVALPFHKDRRPYEAIAFQYSYHLMDEKGSISHKSQYLSFEKGVFPNYDFLRSLRKDLSGKPGTIFRYHKHENTYLNLIYKQLLEETRASVPDKDDLISFIHEISHPSDDTPNPWEARNDMQDLYDLVLNHFYSLYAKGSNSIKDILPSIIKSSAYIQEKYSKPVYGSPVMPSLNFQSPHTWITQESGMNPYETLPELFNDLDRVHFELNDSSLTELNNGGSAMMAYAYLQFTDLPEERRQKYVEGLLRYCELDTMAMVMIWDYWGSEIQRW